MIDNDPPLPAQEKDPLRATGRLHTAHAEDASRSQSLVERITRGAGTPAFIGLLAVLALLWISLNLALVAANLEPFDAPPFAWLQGAAAVTALFIALLILTTQQRDDQLNELRDQLTLELAILSEEKSAKIIALLEELRRDDPSVENREDDHARDLSKAADTGAVLDALKDSQAARTEQRQRKPV